MTLKLPKRERSAGISVFLTQVPLAADGCASIQFDPVHWCQLVEFQRQMQVLGNLYVRAWDLLGVLPPADDQHGRDTYAKAVVARELREGVGRAKTIGVGPNLRVVGSEP